MSTYNQIIANISGFLLLGLVVLIAFAWPHTFSREAVAFVGLALAVGWCVPAAEALNSGYGMHTFYLCYWLCIVSTLLALGLTFWGVFL